jgi:Protein of unknown function (DUF2946)
VFEVNASRVTLPNRGARRGYWGTMPRAFDQAKSLRHTVSLLRGSMRRRTSSPGRRVPKWSALRALTQALALLALFVNAAFLPTLHFASGGPSSAPIDATHAEGHQHHRNDSPDNDKSHGAGHQVCHFCRLVGVALPPPPAVTINAPALAEKMAWEFHANVLPRRSYLRSANLARAPPLPV